MSKHLVTPLFLPDCAGARPSLDSLLTMDRQKIERISKALADQTRLRIFEAINSCDHMNCGQIVSLRGVTPATVSHHLRVLEDAGLIVCRREGQFVNSEANPKAIAAYTRELARLTRKKKK
jgi:ArsR family transcriptional regulator, arsenate/arsenite/antimonite-responsive transcriptional repressor